MLAEKKYPGASDGLAKITALITSTKAGPATHSETAVRAKQLSIFHEHQGHTALEQAISVWFGPLLSMIILHMSTVLAVVLA